MFKDNTVFVIGAGASAEFGMPVGKELMKRIKQRSEPDVDSFPSEINYSLTDSHRTRDEIALRKDALREIHRAIDLAGSIDEFINRHHDNPYIAEAGKLLIAYEISAAERESSIFLPQSEPFQSTLDAVDETWIYNFTQQLFDGIKNSEVENVGKNITIICFNYDRCIEHFLTEAILKTFRDVTRGQAGKIVSEMNIIHPYGSLGELDLFGFGDRVNSENIRTLSENIVTWSESRNSSIENNIQRAITEASTLVFLGFAFAPQNMRLLTVEDAFARERLNLETFATAFGYDPVIDKRLKNKIRDLYSDGIATYNSGPIQIQYTMKCAEFLKAHSMALVV